MRCTQTRESKSRIGRNPEHPKRSDPVRPDLGKAWIDMMINQIPEDKRPIKAIYFNEGSGFRVGIDDITKIQVYGEPGEYCPLPWLAVFKGEQIYQRVPAGMVSITYNLE